MIKLYGASVKGTSHILNHMPCHDAHAYHVFKRPKGVIACVSDGMGSALRAELGSQTATTFIIDYLKSNLNFDMTDEEIIETLKIAYIKTHEKLLETALEHALNIKDLNATLLVFISLKERQFYGQVGDCAAIGKSGDSYQVIVPQQRGEYANATFSICNLESIENGLFGKTDGFYPQVALMSDGIESISISYKDQAVSHLFYDPFFKVFSHTSFDQEAVEKSLTKFLDSERINKRTDDDKTLLFIQVT